MNFDNHGGAQLTGGIT